jgi:hypothetical protein
MSVKFEQSSLKDVFEKNLSIPDYQRPYSWSEEHVEAVLDDTYEFFKKNKKFYQLGTLVLHNKEDKFDIVDGQQRIICLTIILHELSEKDGGTSTGNNTETNSENSPQNTDASNETSNKKPSAGFSKMLKMQLHKHSSFSVKKTVDLVKLFLARLDEKEKGEYRNFLKENVKFWTVTLNNSETLDRAYTFFDSLNSKGLQLSDFDLLKAHHLAYIPVKDEELAKRHNEIWQSNSETHELLFDKILRRIRMWARGQNRDNKRERPNFNEFCSVDIQAFDDSENQTHYLNRYMQPAVFSSWKRINDKVVLSMDWPVDNAEDVLPFEITQTIEGGDPFFLYTLRYKKLYKQLFEIEQNTRDSTAISFVKKLSQAIGSVGGAGNTYLQEAFQAVVLLYFDKFSEDKLVDCASLMEIIISEKRKDASVRIEGVLDHILDKNLIRTILDAISPVQVYTQLFKDSYSLDKIEGKPGKREQHINLLSSFYKSHDHFLSKAVKLRINNFYNVNGEEKNDNKG